LLGGAGADTLTGGNGADTFLFNLLSSSRTSNGIDTIQDFSFVAGDRIDMSLIDADSLAGGDQGFVTQISGTTAFSTAGQFKLTTIAGGFRIDFNTNTTAAAEMSINVLTTDSASGASGWLIA
jgi:serralysin